MSNILFLIVGVVITVVAFLSYRVFVKNKVRKEDSLELAMEVGGHKIYVFKALDRMPVFREMLLRMSYNQMGLGITVGDLVVGMKKIIEHLNKGNVAPPISIANHILLSAEQYGGYKSALQLGGTCVIIDDEPIDSYSEKHMDIKRKLLKDHEELRFFFIRLALLYLNSIQKERDISLTEASLKEERQKRDLLYLRLIGGDISQNLWSLTTDKFLG